MSTKLIAGSAIFAAIMFAQSSGQSVFGAEIRKWSVAGSHLMDLAVLQGERPEFVIATRIMGPRWTASACLPWDHHAQPIVTADGKRVYDNPRAATYAAFYDYPEKPLDKFALRQEVTHCGPSAVQVRYVVTPVEPLTLGFPKNEKSLTIGAIIAHTLFFNNGEATVVQADGKTTTLPLPVPVSGLEDVREIVLQTATGQKFRLECEPPLFLHCDAAELRLFAGGKERPLAGGETFTQDITMTFPGDIAFQPANRMVDKSSWFALRVDEANDLSRPSALPLGDWQDKPAGRYGWIQMKGDQLMFEKTGKPVKLWGTNPLKVEGDTDEKYLCDSAALMEKYGMNIARFHAFTKPNRKGMWAHMLKILDGQDGLKFDAGQLGLLDYGFAQMKEHGIYTKFSVNYGWYPTDACWGRLINAEEAKTLLSNESFYHKHALMPDVQEMLIQTHVNLLNHVNPHTGLRYADDPALAIVELQNEENIFLAVRDHERHLEKAPTYRKLFYERFAKWLKGKYGSQEALAQAWGAALTAGESLEQANITPFPGWIPPEAKLNRRQTDQYHFLYSVQLDFYQRWEKAVHATGYKGLLVGSCWQAADWTGHLYNILSDRAVGIIDRHNYNRIDLRAPGLGLMSAGFQNVMDRPFSFSEWSGGSRPGEGLDVSQVALYGLGLQGWDASMHFAWGYPGMLPFNSTGVNTANNDFTRLAQYPALARIVRRQDLRQGALVGNRRVSIPALKETGDVGFTEQFSLLGGANQKSFNASLPSAALAVGRVVMEFVDGPVEKPVTDTSAPYIDTVRQVVRSTTGQLQWHYGGAGYVTFDTPGSLGVVGFTGGQPVEFKHATLSVETPFASVYIVADGADGSLAKAKSVLISTIARGVNSSTLLDELATSEMHLPVWSTSPEERGTLLVEPVVVDVTWRGGKPKQIIALDHGGSRTTPLQTVPFEVSGKDVRFKLDGRQTKAFYYLMEME